MPNTEQVLAETQEIVARGKNKNKRSNYTNLKTLLYKNTASFNVMLNIRVGWSMGWALTNTSIIMQIILIKL